MMFVLIMRLQVRTGGARTLARNITVGKSSNHAKAHREDYECHLRAGTDQVWKRES
jgi:hypothetical protein